LRSGGQLLLQAYGPIFRGLRHLCRKNISTAAEKLLILEHDHIDGGLCSELEEERSEAEGPRLGGILGSRHS